MDLLFTIMLRVVWFIPVLLFIGWIISLADPQSRWAATRLLTRISDPYMRRVRGLLEKILTYQKLLLAEGVLSMRGSFIGSTPMTNDDIDFTIEAARRALTKLIAA